MSITSSLSALAAHKRQLIQLCSLAVEQQISQHPAENTQLRNRRRVLLKQVLKRIPKQSKRNPERLMSAAVLVLAGWGLLSVSPVEAAPKFQSQYLEGFDVGSRSVPSFADIDNDGDLDAFVGGSSGAVKFYRNTGTVSAPVFVAQAGPLDGLDVNLSTAAPSFADIDNDGDLDAFVGEVGGTVKFYRNTGTVSAPVFEAQAGPLDGVDVGIHAAPSFADIDNDGDLDAFVGGFGGTVKFYRNTGTVSAPVFVAQAGPLDGFDVGLYSAPSFADIDNDGDLDAFVGGVGGADGFVKFYRNTGTVSSPVFVAQAGPLDGVAVGNFVKPSFADIDNDGDLDAFVGESGGTVKFYRNTGTVSAPVFEAQAGPLDGVDVGDEAKPSFADIDNDGDLDAFVGERYGDVKFYRNTGTVSAPVFEAQAGPLADVGYKSKPSFADIDNDGDLDAFVGERFGVVKFYRNTGTVSAPVFVAQIGALNPLDGFDFGDLAAPSFADIDNDGDLDAFVGERNGDVKFYRNTGTVSAPVFEAQAGPLDGFNVGFYAAPSFADIDNDGDLDAFVGESGGTVKFYRNTGTVSASVFEAQAGPLDGFGVNRSASPSFADIDNDGDLDAFVGRYNGTVIFINNFDPQPTLLDDSLQTTENTSATTDDVIANDVFKLDGPVSLFSLSVDTATAEGGTVTNNTNNTFTYLPPIDYVGIDSFSYTLDDGDGTTAAAKVMVMVSEADSVTAAPATSSGGGSSSPWFLLTGLLFALRQRLKRAVLGD
jgi:hypothetical protein